MAVPIEAGFLMEVVVVVVVALALGEVMESEAVFGEAELAGVFGELGLVVGDELRRRRRRGRRLAMAMAAAAEEEEEGGEEEGEGDCYGED